MSIRVVFFASLREDLQCDQVDVELPAVSRVSGLIDQLAAANGDLWRVRLTEENIKVAINQSLVTGDDQISDGDEIAFFPPVTGG